MIHVAEFRYWQALRVGLRALDAKDANVHAACARVQEGFRLARKVSRADLDMIAAFDE